MFEKFFNKRRIRKGVEIDDSIMTATQKEEAIIEVPIKKTGLAAIWYLIIFLILMLSARVFYLDFFQGAYYEEISKGNRIRSIVIKAPRGTIYDKFGKILARNIPSLDAIIIPTDLPRDGAQRKEIASELSQILEMNEANVSIILEKQDLKSINPILLKENITQDQALIIAEKIEQFPGIAIEKTAIRFYENGMIFAPILGYDGKITQDELSKNPGYFMTDYIGKSGLEKSYEKELRGQYGKNQVEVDSLGSMKKNLGVINPKAGNDLVLHIDEDLQKKIYDSLAGILDKTGTKTAAAVAIDPRNGGVLAMVSLPSYDNNMFARGITGEEYQALIKNKDLPLFNRCTNGEYPPGSTLKPAVAAAALMEGTISPETTVNCSGAINVGSWRFGDWKTHGLTDIRKAIAESCDVFFYSVGGGYGGIAGLGMDRMKKYENYFGFGQPTGIDLPDESDGLIPSESWKADNMGEKWYIGDSYHASIGQGYITVTPLQLANYAAMLANGGTLYSPQIVSRTKKNDGTEEISKPKIINNDFISKEAMKVVREGMRQTVVSGTAQTLRDLSVEAAGKTGTAQFGTEDKTHAWFISFAPYDNPKIAMAVLVEGGGEGHSSALPVTEEVYKWYFSR
jgi:penicillin-binding protein 2